MSRGGEPVGFGEPEDSGQQRTWNDLGKFERDPYKSFGEEAQDYVVRRGRETGLEFVLAIDKDGNILAHGHGDKNSAGVSADLAWALTDRTREVVVHHNHPRDLPLSTQDISQLGWPGMRAIWAHGHRGTVSRGELTDRARNVLVQKMDQAAVATLYEIAEAIRREVYPTLSRRAVLREISAMEAARTNFDIIGEVMRLAGILDYRSNVGLFEDALYDAALRPHIDRAVELAARVMFHDEANTARAETSLFYRSTNALRHIGDVGATFERSQKAPGGHDAKTGNDKDRKGNDRGKAPRGFDEGDDGTGYVDPKACPRA
jgi:hypothetical protein